MSQTIDTKVVEMEFDNSDFNQNVESSQESLNGLNDYIKKFGSNGLSTITSAIGTVSNKFSELKIIGLSVLSNLATQAVNTGIQFTKSLTVDNVASGWSKFAEMTQSSATLLAQGYTQSEVTETLEELSWFTDETSYNFTEMQSNMAKFTAAGEGLDDSLDAMEGIALWAATCGQNASTASNVMYQLSQAMGTGVIKAADWKSVVTAQMGNKEFKQMAIAAAVVEGTLQQVGDKFVTTSKAAKAGMEVTWENFEGTLTQGGWFTSDVLMATLSEYSSAVDDVREYAEQNGITASEAMEQFGDSVDQFGLKALKAGQEARSWSDVVNSVKDASSSAFMDMFQDILGTTEETIKFWTNLSNQFYSMFVDPLWEVEKAIADWADTGTNRVDFLNTIYKVLESIETIMGYVGEAFNSVFGSEAVDDLAGLTEALENTANGNIKVYETTKKVVSSTGIQSFINTIIRGITKVTDFVDEHGDQILTVLTGIFAIFKMIGQVLKEAILDPLDVVVATTLGKGENLLNILTKVADKVIEFSESQEFADFLTTVSEKATIAADAIQKIRDKIFNFGNIVKVFNENGGGVEGVFGVLYDISKGVIFEIAEAIGKIFNIDPTKIEEFEEGFDTFLTFLKNTLVEVTNLVVNFFAAFGTGFSESYSEYGGGIGGILAGILGGTEGGLDTLIDEIEKLTGLDLSGVKDIIQQIIDIAQQIVSSVLTEENLKTIGDAISSFFKSLSDSTENGNKVDFKSIFDSLFSIIQNIDWATIGSISGDAINALSSILTSIGNIITNISNVFSNMSGDGNTNAAGAIATLAGIVAVIMYIYFMTRTFTYIDKIRQPASTFFNVIQDLSDGFSDVMESFAYTQMANAIKTLATAIAILVGAMIMISGLDDGAIAKSSAVLAGIFFALMLLFSQLEEIVKSERGVGSQILMMCIGISIAILHLTIALIALSYIDWKKLLPATISLLLVMGSMAAAIRIANNGASGAGAMILMSIALIAMAAAFRIMSTIDPTTMLVIAVAIAGVLAALVVAAYAASEISGPMLAIAGALALFAVAIIAVGAAIAIASLGFAALVNSISGLITTLAAVGPDIIPVFQGFAEVVLYFIEGIVNMLPLIVQKIGEAIVAFAEVIKANAVVIGEAFAAWAIAILTAINEILPLLFETITTFLLGVLQSLIDIVPKLLELIATILSGIIALLYTYLPQIINLVGDLITWLLEFLYEKVPELLTFLMFVSEQLFAFLLELTPKILQFVVDLVFSILQVLIDNIPEFLQKGTDLLLAILQGFVDSQLSLISGVVDILLQLVIDIIEQIGESAIEIADSAAEMVITVCNGIADSLDEHQEEMEKAISRVVTEILETAKDVVLGFITPFSNAGGDLIGGLKNGITNATQTVVNAVSGVASSVLGAAKNIFKVHSPSKAFAEIGMYNDMGLAKGITDNAGLVTDATEAVGEDSLNSLASAMSVVGDQLNGDVNPVITPVLDLDEIQNRMGEVDDMFNTRNLAYQANASYNTNGMIANALLDKLANNMNNQQTGSTVINVTVNGAEGQNVNDLADVVAAKINSEFLRRKAVFGV